VLTAASQDLFCNYYFGPHTAIAAADGATSTLDDALEKPLEAGYSMPNPPVPHAHTPWPLPCDRNRASAGS